MRKFLIENFVVFEIGFGLWVSFVIAIVQSAYKWKSISNDEFLMIDFPGKRDNGKRTFSSIRVYKETFFVIKLIGLILQ